MSVRVNPKAVRELRIERGWSQADLAQLLGRSPRTVQRLESIGRCDIESRSALASVFEVEVGYFNHPDSTDEKTTLKALGHFEAPPPIPMSPSALFAYANAHPRPNDLLSRFGARRKLKVAAIDSESAYLNEQIKVLQIETIRDIDELIAQHGNHALRVSDYLRPEEPVDVAFLISLVLDLVVIDRSGLAGLITYQQGLRYSTGGKAWAEEIYKYSVEVNAYG